MKAAALILLLATAAPALADPADLCRRIEAEATAKAVPPLILARLIAHVSGFDPAFSAPEPTGRARLTDTGPRPEGIAGLPGPIARRLGLADAFDADAGIATVARHLAMLTRLHGNLGLAIAAYDQEEWQVRRYLAGGDPLPPRVEARVQAVTGHRLADWRGADLPLPDSTDFQADCIALANPAPPAPRPAAQPWAVILSIGTDPAQAEALAADWTTRLAPALAGATVGVQPIRLPGRPAPTLSLQIGAPDQPAAVVLCNRLKAAGVTCMVLRNDAPNPAPSPP